MFHGIEQAYAGAMVTAARTAQQTLFDTPICEAIRPSTVWNKGDTESFDTIPENAIVGVLRRFDPYAVVVTEERGAANPFLSDDPTQSKGARTFCVCDPFDRSNQAKQFLTPLAAKGGKIVDILRNPETIANWEKDFGSPASITGFTTGITCVRRGLPIASVILNYLTEEVTLACAAGIFHAKLPEDLSHDINLEYIMQQGKRLVFPQPNHFTVRNIVSYIGKPERGYPKNFSSIRLVQDHELDHRLYYNLPGGPSRILYLSNLQPAEAPIGAVVANGEKIGEWTSWLTFIRFALRADDHSSPALRIFEASQKETLSIDGILMMPTPDYSIFVNRNPDSNRVYISAQKLQDFTNPSKYRATMIVFPASSRWALSLVEQYGYREIVF
ncbi:MAG: hypothetical protein Q8P73_05430 [bacterium]|nr:hypothetical protein [bacterium]